MELHILVSRSPGLRSYFVGLSFTEAGPPELFWLPGVPVSGVKGLWSPALRSYSGFPESRSPELGFPESRSPELRGFPESRSPELISYEKPPKLGVVLGFA